MTPEELKQRAERARQLMSDPLLLESFQNTEAALLMAVKGCKTPDEAFKATIAVQVFDLIKGKLVEHIETGKIVDFNFRQKRFGII